jgi:hypothetical protein
VYCNRTFISLIREIKNDRVREISEIREELANEQSQEQQAIRIALEQNETPPSPSSA